MPRDPAEWSKAAEEDGPIPHRASGPSMRCPAARSVACSVSPPPVHGTWQSRRSSRPRGPGLALWRAPRRSSRRQGAQPPHPARESDPGRRPATRRAPPRAASRPCAATSICLSGLRRGGRRQEEGRPMGMQPRRQAIGRGTPGRELGHDAGVEQEAAQRSTSRTGASSRSNSMPSGKASRCSTGILDRDQDGCGFSMLRDGSSAPGERPRGRCLTLRPPRATPSGDPSGRSGGRRSPSPSRPGGSRASASRAG